MKKISQRLISIDILRSVVIINSIFLHYNHKMNIQNYFLFLYSLIITLYNMFSVGAAFIFVTGIMTYRIYLPKFLKDPKKTTVHLYKKAFFIIIVYLLYINVLRIIYGQAIPSDFFLMIHGHDYLLKILYIFAFLYAFIPFFLVLLKKIKKYYILLFLAFLLAAISHLAIRFLNMPILIRSIFFDMSLFIYAYIPMLAIFLSGVYFGAKFKQMASNALSILAYCFLFWTISIILWLILKINAFYVFFEAANIAIIIFGLEFALKNISKLKNFFNSPKNKLLKIGEKSFTAYVGGNMIIALLPNLRGLGALANLSILILIIIFAYFISIIDAKSVFSKK